MDLVTIPQALMIVYGAVVLGCGAVLGFIAGRQRKRAGNGGGTPGLSPLDGTERRLRLLEEELQLSQQQIEDLIAERDFMRELRRFDSREPREGDSRGRHVA